jgi:hypothetical protein
MKLRELDDGDLLRVGDVVIAKNDFGVFYMVITRLTKKYAVSKTGRFPIKYGFDFKSLPRQRWCSTEHTAYRKVDVTGDKKL